MTRDRQAAMDRAVAAYRRLISVRATHTAAEMIADLIEWHKLYVDKNVDVTALLETATRRAEVVEAGRDSVSRANPPADAPQPGGEMPRAIAFDEILRQARTYDNIVMHDTRATMMAPPIEFTLENEGVEGEDDVEF